MQIALKLSVIKKIIIQTRNDIFSNAPIDAARHSLKKYYLKN